MVIVIVITIVIVIVMRNRRNNSNSRYSNEQFTRKHNKFGNKHLGCIAFEASGHLIHSPG